ncbi:hypothetical protein Dimus_011183 [Dionaea muscipula]
MSMNNQWAPNERGFTCFERATETGQLFVWGNAKDSQLGVPGLPEIQSFPVEVKFLMEDDELGPHKVLAVAVGQGATRVDHGLCCDAEDSPSKCRSWVEILLDEQLESFLVDGKYLLVVMARSLLQNADLEWRFNLMTKLENFLVDENTS